MKSEDVYVALVEDIEKTFETSYLQSRETTTHRKKQKSDRANKR